MKTKLLYVAFPLALLLAGFGYVLPMIERQKYVFELDGAHGKVRLSDFRGKAVAVYFGYTHCPDICPMSLSTLDEAKDLLSDKEAAEVQVIFVSVDPDRDNAASLETYVHYFDPTFVGLTASKAVIDEMVSRYDGTAYTMLEQNNTAMGYTVGHTSFVYFFDRQGNFVGRLNHSVDPKQTADYFKKALGHAGV